MRAVGTAILLLLVAVLALFDGAAHAVAGGCECAVHGTRLLILDGVTIAAIVASLAVLARGPIRALRRR
jgi:hypothetical protein